MGGEKSYGKDFCETSPDSRWTERFRTFFHLIMVCSSLPKWTTSFSTTQWPSRRLSNVGIQRLSRKDWVLYSEKIYPKCEIFCSLRRELGPEIFYRMPRSDIKRPKLVLLRRSIYMKMKGIRRCQRSIAAFQIIGARRCRYLLLNLHKLKIAAFRLVFLLRLSQRLCAKLATWWSLGNSACIAPE